MAAGKASRCPEKHSQRILKVIWVAVEARKKASGHNNVSRACKNLANAGGVFSTSGYIDEFTGERRSHEDRWSKKSTLHRMYYEARDLVERDPSVLQDWTQDSKTKPRRSRDDLKLCRNRQVISARLSSVQQLKVFFA